MSSFQDLYDCFQQDITIERYAGRSDCGDPAYLDQEIVKARVEPNRNKVTNVNGEEVMANFVLFAATEICLFDRVWLPKMDPSCDSPEVIKSIFEGIDENGETTHYEVFL